MGFFMGVDDLVTGFRDTSQTTLRRDFNLDSELQKKFQPSKKPWGYWKSDEGKSEAKSLIWPEINHLLHTKDWTPRDFVMQGNYKILVDALKKKDKKKGDNGAFNAFVNVYQNSHIYCFLDWLRQNPDPFIRMGYGQIKPSHFKNPPVSYWEGEEGKINARPLIREVIQHLEKSGWSLPEIVMNIEKKHFEQVFEKSTPDGPIPYTPFNAFSQVYKKSTSQATLDCMQHDPEQRVREFASDIFPPHFRRGPSNYWKGTAGVLHGEQVMEEQIRLKMKKKGISYDHALDILSPAQLKGKLSKPTSEGEVVYSAYEGLRRAFGSTANALNHMKKVRHSRTHPFIQDYDPSRSLESQLELPLRFGDVEFDIESDTGKYLLTVSNTTTHLPKMEGTFTGLILRDGYLSNREITEIFPPSWRKLTYRINSKIGKKFLTTCRSAGVYFGENPALYRLQLDNFLLFDNLTLNKVTNCVFEDISNPQILTNYESFLLQRMSQEGGIDMNSENESLKQPLRMNICNLRKKLRNVGYTHPLGKNGRYAIHSHFPPTNL